MDPTYDKSSVAATTCLWQGLADRAGKHDTESPGLHRRARKQRASAPVCQHLSVRRPDRRAVPLPRFPCIVDGWALRLRGRQPLQW